MILHLLVLAYISKETITQQSDPEASPCPDIFHYENQTEPDKWFGIITIQSTEELSGIYITVKLDSKAELLGNWFGETISSDNKDFRITNPDYILEPGPPVAIRFFVKYNESGPIPRLETIRLNGKLICPPTNTELKPTTPKLHISKPRPATPAPNIANNEQENTRPVIHEETNQRPSSSVDTTGDGYNRPNRPIGGIDASKNTPITRPFVDVDTNLGGYYPPIDRPVGDVNAPVNPHTPPITRPVVGIDTTSNGYNPSGRPVDGTPVRFNNNLSSNSAGDRNIYPGATKPPVNPGGGYDTVTKSSYGEDGKSVTGNEAVVLNINDIFSPSYKPDVNKVNDTKYSEQPHKQETGQNINNPNRGVRPGTPIYNVDRNRQQSNSLPNNAGNSISNQDNHSTANKSRDPEDDFFPGDFNVIKVTTTADQTNKHTIGSHKTVGCGTVALRPKALISYGQDTIPGEWPWHGAIYHTKGIQLVYICGASLISDRYVLTAAHCVSKPRSNKQVEPEGILVYFGKYNLRTFGPETQDRDVAEIRIHPEFNFSMYYNDIAILKLSRPIEITDYVRPVCLWEEDTNLEYIVNKEGTVIGWGFDENKRISEKLLQANMPIVSTIQCIYSNRDFFARFTFDKNFCAGFRNGTAVCNGDSGGSMVFPKKGTSGQNTVWQIRGIVSVGVALQTEGICDTSQYVIFTDVAKHLTWIREILNSN